MLSPEHRPHKHHDYVGGNERHMNEGRPAMRHYDSGKGSPEQGLESGCMKWKEKGAHESKLHRSEKY